MATNKKDPFSYRDYTPSSSVKKSWETMDQHNSAKPQNYTPSQYQTLADDALKKYLTRDKFSYDVNGDALYEQYKDNFMQQGKIASQDATGQAAALTGGYGNSHAATVGNQAYLQHIKGLNDIVPQLYQMAYDRYNQEGQDLLNAYGVASERENQEYGRYQDSLAAWQADRDFYTSQYNAERDRDYSQFAENRNFAYGQYVDDRNFAYQQDRDSVADQQWQQQFDYGKERDYVTDSQWNAQFNEAMRQYNDSRSSSSGWNAPLGYTPSDIATLQSAAGLTPTGVWDEATQRAYESRQKANTGSVNGTQTYRNVNAALTGKGYNNGSLTPAQVKELQAVLGVEQDGKYGDDAKELAYGLGANDAYKIFVEKGAKPKSGPSFSNKTLMQNQSEQGGSSYSSVMQTMREFKVAGKSNQEAMEYLKELMQNSLISPSDMANIYNKYRDNKL